MASRAPTLSVRVIWPFRAVSQELGLDGGEVWEAQGVPVASLEDPDTRVPIDVAQRMAGWVVDATGMSDFGIRAALRAEPGLFDLPEYAARNKPTLGRALECIARLLPLISDAGTLRITRQGGVASLTLEPSVELHPSSVEFSFAYYQRAARRFTGIETLRPIEVHFAHAAPADASAHERFFRCPVVFAAGSNASIVPAEQLELRILSADTQLGALLDRVAEQQLAEAASGTSFADAVRRDVSRQLADTGAPVSAVAEILGVTPRTLHRRLAEEGTTFRELADDVRRKLARAHLERRDLSIAEVAYLLGFSGVQAFHRAFRRWTGETPGAYRRRHGTA